MARSPRLRRGGMDGQIGVLQIDVMPFEAKKLAASETGVQRDQKEGLEMIGELSPTQVGQERVLAFRTPTVRAIALVAEFFLPCIQRRMKPFPFLGRKEAHRRVGIDLGAFDTRERMRSSRPLRRVSRTSYGFSAGLRLVTRLLPITACMIRFPLISASGVSVRKCSASAERMYRGESVGAGLFVYVS